MSGQTPVGDAAGPNAPETGHQRRITVTVGAHLGRPRSAALDLCEELLEKVPSISHIARYSTGTCDFTLDVDPPSGQTEVLGPTADERQLLGRDIVHVMTDLDAQLRPARSGDLIRVLLHTERGALFGLAVLREQFLVALARAAGPVEQLATRDAGVRVADLELARLANRLRESVSQQPADYGGWLGVTEPVLNAGLRDGRPAAGPATSPVPPDADEVDPGQAPYPVDGPEAGDSPEALAATCRRHLGVDGLHYAAVCRSGRVDAAADILDDPRLARFFDGITPERRRRFYGLVGERVDVYLRTLVRAAHLALGARVRRLVLDVEQGALYCYPIGLDRYLLGVTLDQHLVWAADDSAALLSRQLGG